MAVNRIWGLFSVAGAALLGAGMAPLAFAADLPVAPGLTPRVAAVNWTGLYFGGDIAAVFNSSDYSRPLSGLYDTTIGNIDSHPAFGVYGGFNYQVAPWAVIGIEGAYTWLGGAEYRELGPDVDFLQKSRYVASIAGRFGVVLRPDTMVYGKFGPAWIETEGFQGFGDTFRQTLPAVQAGVGIEALVTPNLALRAEASYTRATELLSLNQGFDQYRPAILLFNVGLAYKFDAPAGWGVPAAAPATAHVPMVYKAPPPAAGAPLTPNWTGFEVGGFLSANGNKVTFNDTVLGETGPYTSLRFGGGWFAGANYQFQRLVIGVEASGNYEAAKFYTAAGSGGLTTNYYNFAKIDRTLALTARAGWLVTPDTLLYVKGGPAEIRMSPNSLYFNSVAPNPASTVSLRGYEAGVGAETYVTQNISLRVEGMYTYTGGTIVLDGTVPNEFTLKPYLLSGMVGGALHF
jgi:outer membrane immunogenic protein